MNRVNVACSAVMFLTALSSINAASLDVFVKGVDDGVVHSKQQDYREALLNAKLQAIEQAGIDIQSITQVSNFKTKFDTVEAKANAVLMPGFKIMDIGYQEDGVYQVVLTGKVASKGGKKDAKRDTEKSHLEAQNVLDELRKTHTVNIGFISDSTVKKLKKKITYYKAFLNDWEGTPQAAEASEELNAMSDQLNVLQRRVKIDKRVKQLLPKTGIDYVFKAKGNLAAPVSKGSRLTGKSKVGWKAACMLTCKLLQNGYHEFRDIRREQLPDSRSKKVLKIYPGSYECKVTYGVKSSSYMGGGYVDRHTKVIKVPVVAGKVTTVTLDLTVKHKSASDFRVVISDE